jgi:hypothetical protein
MPEEPAARPNAVSEPSIAIIKVPAKVQTHKALVFLVGLVSSAFGAGAGTQIALEKARNEVSAMIAPVQTQADEARREAFTLQQDIRQLRVDLARGFGRALTPPLPGRDRAGVAALRLYQSELARGTPPAEAMRIVLENDF